MFDVCRALGFTGLGKGVSRYLARLSPDEHMTATLVGRGGQPAGFTDVIVISESGLYKLIMRSDKPEARQFQDWVAGVVLPALHRDGGYVMGEEKVVTGELSIEEMTAKVMAYWISASERLLDGRPDHKIRDMQN